MADTSNIHRQIRYIWEVNRTSSANTFVVRSAVTHSISRQRTYVRKYNDSPQNEHKTDGYNKVRRARVLSCKQCSICGIKTSHKSVPLMRWNGWMEDAAWQ